MWFNDFSHSVETLKTYFREHGSMVFFVILFAIGLLTAWGGHLLQVSGHEALGAFLVHFSGALVAVTVAAILFNLAEMRNRMADMIKTLLFRGDIVPLLGPEPRRELLKKLCEESVSQCASRIPELLYNYLDERNLSCCSSPHWENYTHQLEFSPHKTFEGMLIAHCNVSYSLGVIHLKPEKRNIHLRWTRVGSFPGKSAPAIESWFENFSVMLAGDVRFGIESLTVDVIPDDKKGTKKYKAVFEKSVAVPDDALVEIKASFVRSPEDPTRMASCQISVPRVHG